MILRFKVRGGYRSQGISNFFVYVYFLKVQRITVFNILYKQIYFKFGGNFIYLFYGDGEIKVFKKEKVFYL